MRKPYWHQLHRQLLICIHEETLWAADSATKQRQRYQFRGGVTEKNGLWIWSESHFPKCQECPSKKSLTQTTWIYSAWGVLVSSVVKLNLLCYQNDIIYTNKNFFENTATQNIIFKPRTFYLMVRTCYISHKQKNREQSIVLWHFTEPQSGRNLYWSTTSHLSLFCLGIFHRPANGLMSQEQLSGKMKWHAFKNNNIKTLSLF